MSRSPNPNVALKSHDKVHRRESRARVFPVFWQNPDEHIPFHPLSTISYSLFFQLPGLLCEHSTMTSESIQKKRATRACDVGPDRRYQ